MPFKNDRLFQLLYLLLEKERLSAPELAERLEVSVRTVYRDVEALAMAGVPVYAVAGKGGGISLLPGYRLDKTLLSDKEQDELLFAVQSLQAADQQVDSLLHKLGGAFQKPGTDWIAVDFSRWGMRWTDTQRFEALKTAILGKQVVRLDYCGASGERTERCVHPLRLIYKSKHWYLQAYCLQADDFRLFKVGRILCLTPTGELFAQTYELPPVEAEGLPCRCAPMKLRFPARMAFRVYDEFDHSAITKEPDGGLLVEVALTVDEWTTGHLFSFGTEVEILEPLEWKQVLRDYAEKIAAHYQT